MERYSLLIISISCICNADIIVNIKVKVNNLGRGRFLYEKNDK